MTDTILVLTEARFVTPPLGLEPRTDYSIEYVQPSVGLVAFAHSDGVRFRALDASHRLDWYAQEEANKYYLAVDAASADDVLVYVVLTAGDGAITANLDAPLIVNRATGQARQVIHPGELSSLRVPLKDLLGQ